MELPATEGPRPTARYMSDHARDGDEDRQNNEPEDEPDTTLGHVRSPWRLLYGGLSPVLCLGTVPRVSSGDSPRLPLATSPRYAVLPFLSKRKGKTWATSDWSFRRARWTC